MQVICELKYFMRVAPLREQNVLCIMLFDLSLCVLFMIISRYYNRITCQHVVKFLQTCTNTHLSFVAGQTGKANRRKCVLKSKTK